VPDVLLAVVEDGVLLKEASSATVPWWSFTKLVISTCALALVAEGRLALDAPVGGRAFTLRHLLQHRGGLPDYGGIPDYAAAVARGEQPWDEPVLMARVGADRLLFEPGQGWSYSNIGYLIVRHLIEGATGETLDAALRRFVLAPLAIEGPRIARVPADLDATAWGNAANYDPRWVYHGLLVGKPSDAALLLWRILAGSLLSIPLRKELTQPHRLDVPLDPGRPFKAPAYGLGVMIDRATGVMGHTGGGPGSTAAVYFAPYRHPRRVAAAFADVEQPGLVEERAMRMLE
jgi:CubicO group peptidase (beta-lactamase class C family)